MKCLPALAISCFLFVPAVLHGQQISPNPNPAGSTIAVDTDSSTNGAAWGIGSLTIDTFNLKITWFVLAMVALQGESYRYRCEDRLKQTFRQPANQKRLP